jgi:hypothetical protein
LDAVNAMLSAIGESLISSFDDEFGDAAVAKDLIRQELRSLQNGQWTFNTELDYTLTPDVSGHIHVPQNVLRLLYIASPDATNSADVVHRGRRLYDRRRHSYEFARPVACDLVVALQFEELPEAARRFIFVRASRKFQDRLGGDQTLHSFQVRDEQVAWAALENYEAEVAQWNALNESPLHWRVKRYRNSPYSIMSREAISRD